MIDWFVIDNYHFKNNSFSCGWGNGYVILRPDHPYYMMGYYHIMDRMDLNVELTFGESCKLIEWPEIKQEWRDNDYYLVGFNTIHWGMNEENWPKKRVEEETARLAWSLHEVWLLKEREKNLKL